MLKVIVLVALCAATSAVDLGDVDLDVPELITKYGYPSETHRVNTEDGYILRMHRIPYGKGQDPHQKRPVAFVMHGLISSSADFIVSGPGLGLGYILADEGFDVWLSNARGNYYSRRHRWTTPIWNMFWNFSWDEIGNFDIPAMIDYALGVTGQDSVHYIGHSQGTTAYFVMNSLRPEYSKKIKTAQLLAPVVFMEHFPTQELASLASYSNLVANIGSLSSYSEIFSKGGWFRVNRNGEVKCSIFNLFYVSCQAVLGAFQSGSVADYDPEMLPVILSHFPAGSSIKQVAHYGQAIRDNRFHRWDHTTLVQNMAAYGSRDPPEYDITLATAKTYLHYAVADTVADEADVLRLEAVLPDATARRVPDDKFTHFDFAWGRRVRELVYDDMIEKMNYFETSQK